MTEAEWLDCTYPPRMLEFLHGKVSDRKLRLFACACCRRIWHLLIDERSRKAVELAERFADGLATRQDLAAVTDPESVVFKATQPTRAYDATDARRVAARIAESGVEDAFSDANYDHDEYLKGVAARDVERIIQARLLRCCFGNPFRSVPFDPSWIAWNDGTIRKLAQLIYDDRAFDRLPLLADALEDAGCTDADILGHCRGGGEHVRGCWVVDLLLGKS